MSGPLKQWTPGGASQRSAEDLARQFGGMQPAPSPTPEGPGMWASILGALGLGGGNRSQAAPSPSVGPEFHVDPEAADAIKNRFER